MDYKVGASFQYPKLETPLPKIEDITLIHQAYISAIKQKNIDEILHIINCIMEHYNSNCFHFPNELENYSFFLDTFNILPYFPPGNIPFVCQFLASMIKEFGANEDVLESNAFFDFLFTYFQQFYKNNDNAACTLLDVIYTVSSKSSSMCSYIINSDLFNILLEIAFEDTNFGLTETTYGIFVETIKKKLYDIEVLDGFFIRLIEDDILYSKNRALFIQEMVPITQKIEYFELLVSRITFGFNEFENKESGLEILEHVVIRDDKNNRIISDFLMLDQLSSYFLFESNQKLVSKFFQCYHSLLHYQILKIN